MINEAHAKKILRDALAAGVPSLMTWTNTDAFRHGLPDFFIAFSGRTVAVEAKFVRTLPKRGSSQALTHEVSQSQIQFLSKFTSTGNVGVILIALSDVFVYTFDFKRNYTKDELLALPRIERGETGKGWDFSGFLDALKSRGNT